MSVVRNLTRSHIYVPLSNCKRSKSQSGGCYEANWRKLSLESTLNAIHRLTRFTPPWRLHEKSVLIVSGEILFKIRSFVYQLFLRKVIVIASTPSVKS